MSDKQKLIVDSEKIATAIRLGVPIAITSYTLPRETEEYINDVIIEFLKQLHRPELADYIMYYTKELTTNAKKANTKRIYFQEKGLDINKLEEYEVGMESFKDDTLSNIDYYLNLQKKAGLYVKLSLQATPKNIILEVVNNVTLTRFEFKRIFDKIVRAKEFSSLDEAFTQVLDSTEGAGLGLVIMVLMLKKMGLNEKAFETKVEKNATINRVVIPRDCEFEQQAEPLTKAIVDYIEDIPQFPENIMQIQRAINDPDSKITHIAQLISNDIGLSTDLLKLVNSAAFALSNPCINISEAVKMVGLRGIQNLLYSIGTVQVLGANEDEQKELWHDAYKLAFFSFNAAKLTGKNSIVENSYVCGLLRDLGKVILHSMYPELILKLAEIQAERNIPPQIMDMIMSGMEQAEIGARLAEKWNFPDLIIKTIRYQNNFEATPEDARPLVETIAFADFMISLAAGKIEYYQIPQPILSRFKIKSKEQLEKLCERFELGFEQEYQGSSTN